MTDQHEALDMLADQATRLLEEQAAPERLKLLLEEPGTFDRILWKQAVELGWPAAAIAEERGGFGLGFSSLTLLSEVLGRHTLSLPLIPAAIIADAAQQTTDAEVIIGALAAGEAIGCIALGQTGESGLSSGASLRLQDDRLSGTTAIAPYAAVADHALCYAATDNGTALILIALDQAEVTRTVVQTIDNARAAASLTFAGARVVKLDCDDSHAAMLQAASLASIATAFEQVGGAQRCLELGIAYAKDRIVFGQPIGRMQAIKHKLSDIYSEIQIARGCAIDALEAVQSGKGAVVPMAAMARIAGIKAYEFAARETIQVYGGIGVTWEADPQHHYRRSRALALELGGAPFWRELLIDNVFALAEA